MDNLNKLTKEELQNKILEQEEKIKELELDKSNYEKRFTDLETSKNELEERNKKLEEHNQQLFLRATATFEPSNNKTYEDKEEKPKVLDEFAENLKEDDINILLELIEGEE